MLKLVEMMRYWRSRDQETLMCVIKLLVSCMVLSSVGFRNVVRWYVLFSVVMEYHISAGNAWDGLCMKEDACATVKVISFYIEISEAFAVFFAAVCLLVIDLLATLIWRSDDVSALKLCELDKVSGVLPFLGFCLLMIVD